jgi:uncharacterized membrane protein
MAILKKSSHIRSVLKGFSWRVLATTDTILVVLLVTCLLGNCSIEGAIKIGASEFLFKLAIFYFHERIWLLYLGKQATSSKEILYKSISWRMLATASTFVISGIILNDFGQVAMYVAAVEFVTKFILYYVHEKMWLRLPLGKIRSFFFVDNICRN